MTQVEKLLYHQIHPLKLLVDVGTSFASTWLLWEARWGLAASVGFLPSVITSVLLVALVDLERYKCTPLGHYVTRYMTASVTALRIAGQLLMWLGAALHIPWLPPFGFIIVIFAWLSGLLDPAPGDGPHMP